MLLYNSLIYELKNINHLVHINIDNLIEGSSNRSWGL